MCNTNAGIRAELITSGASAAIYLGAAMPTFVSDYFSLYHSIRKILRVLQKHFVLDNTKVTSTTGEASLRDLQFVLLSGEMIDGIV